MNNCTQPGVVPICFAPGHCSIGESTGGSDGQQNATARRGTVRRGDVQAIARGRGDPEPDRMAGAPRSVATGTPRGVRDVDGRAREGNAVAGGASGGRTGSGSQP